MKNEELHFVYISLMKNVNKEKHPGILHLNLILHLYQHSSNI